MALSLFSCNRNFSVAKCQADFDSGEAPAAADLVGKWVAVGLATAEIKVFEASGLQQGNRPVWTLEFSDAESLRLDSRYVGTRPQTPTVTVTDEQISFRQGYDTDLAFDFHCRIARNGRLVCLEATKAAMGLEFKRAE